MDKNEYREALAKLDLSQAAAGEIFGVGARTSRRWALGQTRVPPSVGMLLKLMVSKRIKLELKIPVSAERRVWTLQAKEAIHAME